jgi:hypothetical protein
VKAGLWTFQSVQGAVRQVECVGELLIQELDRAHSNILRQFVVAVRG